MSDDADPSETRVTVWMDQAVRERLDDEYVDWRHGSRSAWVREAVETRMTIEDALANQGVTLPDERADREQLIETIVATGVAAVDVESLVGDDAEE